MYKIIKFIFKLVFVWILWNVIKYTFKGIWSLFTSIKRSIKNNRKQKKADKEFRRITANPPSYEELCKTIKQNIKELEQRLSSLKPLIQIKGVDAKETRQKRSNIRKKIEYVKDKIEEEKFYLKNYKLKMEQV